MWSNDVNILHTKFKGKEWIEEKLIINDTESLQSFLDFRNNLLKEEMEEIQIALKEKNSEELVDGLIDLCVIAIGTLELFKVDVEKAWDEVYNANITKEVGIKPERFNPLGLPDLIKPEGWKGPSHEHNTGIFDLTMKKTSGD